MKNAREFLSLLRKYAGVLHTNIVNNTELSEHWRNYLFLSLPKSTGNVYVPFGQQSKKLMSLFLCKAMDFFFFLATGTKYRCYLLVKL